VTDSDRTFRAFVAVGVPDDVREALAREQRRLRETLRISWVRPESMHLTLHFLDQIGWDQARRIAEALERCTAAHAAFDIRCAGLGVFPNADRPRGLWAGIEDGEPLIELQRAMRAPLRRCGARTERRRYHPHLTLARIRRPLERQGLSFLGHRLQDAAGDYGTIPVREIHLYRSVLEPTGARYSVEASAMLGP